MPRNCDVSLALFFFSTSGNKTVAPFLTASSISEDIKYLGWRKTCLKEMCNFAALSAKVLKSEVEEEREREKYSSAGEQSKSRPKTKSSQRVFQKLKERGRSLGLKSGKKETARSIGR